MTNILVKLVKYDTEKTKKRKRENLLVDTKTEKAVIEKLEKIHKNDKIEAIHEIVWEEIKTQEKVKPKAEVLTGTIKFFNTEKKFGFIAPDDDIDSIFFHETALGGAIVYEHDVVEFEISEGPKGPIAIRIKLQ